ncbi:hypothetical protein FisN_9Lh006 [Fistulifera solaris]|uniref:Meiotic nuclear division protein 1 n=1 Tax=Fistulifera solaris TaxID=1519565 RepID=A0A1Z5KI53_FISSO|nr:hypothetical protein FisN_9Lh006 [Fistulifera solaris]|eukprot:GAX25805.1 hypothetical protein FisN_9Lh006 [Fistulifera solaris]
MAKRMSLEEKRKTILSIYHNTKQVYTEKEMSVLAAKAGVNANAFTDVHNGLVEDDLVDKDKIGGSNFFWSFPAKKDRMMQLQHQDRLKNIEKLKIDLTEAQAQLADAKRGREEDDDGTRARKLARLQEISSLMKPLETELVFLKENDPQALADLQHELKLCREAANRWTDNIFNAQSYLVKKRGFGKKAANKLLGITDSFDYPEDKFTK